MSLMNLLVQESSTRAVTAFEQLVRHVRADEAGAAGDQDSFKALHRPPVEWVLRGASRATPDAAVCFA